MYAPYPENMMESIKKVEATRAERMATEPKRLTADEKDALLKEFHPVPGHIGIAIANISDCRIA